MPVTDSMMKVEPAISIAEKPNVAMEMPAGQPGKLELFEATILPHLNAGYNLARWLLRDESNAQDAVQEAFLRAYRFFDGYHGGDPKAWLLAIVRNTCVSWQRKTQREAPRVEFDEGAHSDQGPTAEEALVKAGQVGALRRCIEALPADYREILILREFEEMSYQQIAETANLPVGTVMSRLARARQRLADCVNGRRSAGR